MFKSCIKKSLFILNPNLSFFPMQLIIKKIFYHFFFHYIFWLNQSKVIASNKIFFDDYGLISIMYHRFNESKYPSTNIQLDVFKEHLKIIEKEGIKFINPSNLKLSISEIKKNEKFYSL